MFCSLLFNIFLFPLGQFLPLYFGSCFELLFGARNGERDGGSEDTEEGYVEGYSLTWNKHECSCETTSVVNVNSGSTR